MPVHCFASEFFDYEDSLIHLRNQPPICLTRETFRQGTKADRVVRCGKGMAQRRHWEVCERKEKKKKEKKAKVKSVNSEERTQELDANVSPGIGR